MKKIIIFVMLALIIFAACDGTEDSGNEARTETNESVSNEEADEENIEQPAPEQEGFFLDGTIYEQLLDSPVQLLQLLPLVPGEELAVLHTNFGDITLRFFPEEAPLAVENFVTHAKNGYYDNVIFHRVWPEFMIQGGDPLGTGVGGESIWGEGFGLERSFNLFHFRGALAAAQRRMPNTIGSQFYIVQNTTLEEGFRNHFENIRVIQNEIAGEFSDGRHIYIRDVFPDEAMAHFIENGGTPHLDWHWNADNYGHTVFGHVVSGMDVVDAIANTPSTPSNYHDEAMRNRPYEDVIIESISFYIYE